MSWFAVVNGTHKYVVYGTGDEGVIPQLFDLVGDPDETTNMFNTSDAARAGAAALDQLLRTQIDYPSVARDVALYQKQQFEWWAVNGTDDWEKEISGPALRWSASWAAHPAKALAAVKAWRANATIAIRPCDGRITNL